MAALKVRKWGRAGISGDDAPSGDPEGYVSGTWSLSDSQQVTAHNRPSNCLP